MEDAEPQEDHEAVFRIHMFLGLPDPVPLIRGMDPDPAPDHQAKSWKLFCDFLDFPDPDPLVRGMDARIRIRIHTKMSWIWNTAWQFLGDPADVWPLRGAIPSNFWVILQKYGH
jgi:hypothetical protein